MIARGKLVATMSMVMFKICNLRFQIVRGRTISRATGTTNRLLTDTIKGGDVSGVQVTPHTTPDAMVGVPVPLRKMKNVREAGKYQVNIETLKAGEETIAKKLAKLYLHKTQNRTTHP